ALPHKIETQVAFLEQHPGVGCLLAHHELVYEPGIDPVPEDERDPIFGDPRGVTAVSALVRADALRVVGAFDPSYRVAEGIEWLGRLRSSGVEIAVIDRVVTRRRVHETNLSRDHEQMRSALAHGMWKRITANRSAAAEAAGNQ